MTGHEFDTIRPLLNISAERENAARLAIVDGQTLKSVATLYGWSHQAVSDAVTVVWNTFERYRESQHVAANAVTSLPPGWEQVTLTAPHHLIPKFRAEIAQAHTEKLDIKKQPSKGVAKKKKV